MLRRWRGMCWRIRSIRCWSAIGPRSLPSRWGSSGRVWRPSDPRRCGRSGRTITVSPTFGRTSFRPPRCPAVRTSPSPATRSPRTTGPRTNSTKTTTHQRSIATTTTPSE
uniref:(northern house mosquito) hypothetical protein n=1 Tax=Culex pipiens TaxID=7175 RepID=A0A8D8L0G5_CULPI